MKKIFNFPIKKILEAGMNKKAETKIKLPEIKPDVFEATAQNAEASAKQAADDMGNMVFKERLFKLFPEDLEKLRQLPESEKPAFVQRMRAEGRYTEIFED